MIETFKQFVNSVSSPVIIFSSATIVFLLFVSFPRQATSKGVSLAVLLVVLGFFGIGLTDPHFRKIVSTPDNVPIVGMIFIFGYFTWYAMRKAVQNDRRMEKGEPPIEQLETNMESEPKLWFLIGPGVFIVGLFFGLSSRKKRRSSLL